MRGQRLKAVLAVGILCMVLCACGRDSNVTKETTVRVGQDGTVTNTIIENFDGSLYSADDLQSMMLSEVSSFNSATGGKSITIDKVEASEGQIEVAMTYANASVYEEFNERTFFYGTMKEFYGSGIKTEGIVLHTKDDESYGMEELLKKEDTCILVLEKSKTEGSIRIETPSKILYVSDNVEFLSGKSARVSADTEEPAYLIVKGEK